MVIKKKPIRDLPKPYVPPGGKPFPVGGTKPAWNWASVAAYHGLKDVWKDLIEFNFPTVAYETSFQDKCAAVNWYLENHLGCTKSNDGVNYSFEGAKVPTIYVPTVVTNDIGLRAARSVLAVLGSSYVNHIDFVLDGMFIHSPYFHKVGHAILDAKIGIAVNPSGLSPDAEAEYDYTTSPPMFNLRYSRLITPFQKSVVIHEAVHAISHMIGKDRKTIVDEGGAYVAQAIYHREKTASRLEYKNQPVKDEICKAADALATKVLKNKLLDQQDALAIQKQLVKTYPLGTYDYSSYPFPKQG